MTHIKFHMKIFVIMAAFFGSNVLAEENGQYLKVHLVNKNCKPILKMELLNITKNEISFVASSLPWREGIFGANVWIHSLYKHGLIGESYAFDDAEEIVRIKPGDFLSGEIDLMGRFPSLVNSIRTSPHAIYWSYILSANGQEYEPQIGAVLLEKCSESK